MLSQLRRFNPVERMRRLLRLPPPVVSLAVQDAAVGCPEEPAGAKSIERCMQCDRLIVLEVDAEGNGTVECRPDNEPEPGVSTQNGELQPLE